MTRTPAHACRGSKKPEKLPTDAEHTKTTMSLPRRHGFTRAARSRKGNMGALFAEAARAEARLAEVARQAREELTRLDQLTREQRPRKKDRPRCGAKTRAGGTCQAPAQSCGRCRMHGGANSTDDTKVARLVIAHQRRELLAVIEVAEALS
jgi:hypothetical protein